jgi:putative ABC transport system permease protein
MNRQPREAPMRFLIVVLKNTIRRPLRSILTVFAIAIAVGSVVSLVGIASGFEESFLTLYKGAGVDLIVVRAGAKQRLTSTLDESLGAEIKKVPGVREVIPGLADVVSFEEFNLYGVLVQGWVPETVAFKHITILEGRALKRDDQKAVMLGSVLAKSLGKKVGDRLDISGDKDYEVVGIYKSNNIFEEGALIIPLAQLQRMMERTGQVTGFSILAENPHDKAALERIRHKVEGMESGLTVLTTDEHVKSVTEIQLAKAMAWLTSSVALLIGFFGIMNTMIMSVHERTKEIGILRAIGWRRHRVLRMILLESIVLSVVGAIFGSLGAFILVRLLTRVPTVSGLISGRIDPIFILYGLLIALVVGFIGGLLPAYRASRMLPTVALRYE